jgi:hypothetical protein
VSKELEAVKDELYFQRELASASAQKVETLERERQQLVSSFNSRVATLDGTLYQCRHVYLTPIHLCQCRHVYLTPIHLCQCRHVFTSKSSTCAGTCSPLSPPPVQARVHLLVLHLCRHVFTS